MIWNFGKISFLSKLFNDNSSNRVVKTTTFEIGLIIILLVGTFGLGMQSIYSLSCEIDPITGECIKFPEVASPLSQFKAGVLLDEIFCHPNKTLLIKESSGTPACVYDADKLIERGWGIFLSEFSPAGTYPEQVNISMEFTACFGFCPTYSVTISEDGAVTFVGYENVQKLGTVEYSITESEVISIVEKIHEVGFYGLEDEYDPNITDVPRIIISSNLDGDAKSVKSPSHAMPESLKTIAILISDLTDVQKYVGEKQSFFEQPSEEQQFTILHVHSNLVDCVGVGPQKCMQVRESPHLEWKLFYDGIEGFDFQEGTNYKLEVIIKKTENPPADASSQRYILHQILESYDK